MNKRYLGLITGSMIFAIFFISIFSGSSALAQPNKLNEDNQNGVNKINRVDATNTTSSTSTIDFNVTINIDVWGIIMSVIWEKANKTGGWNISADKGLGPLFLRKFPILGEDPILPNWISVPFLFFGGWIIGLKIYQKKKR